MRSIFGKGQGVLSIAACVALTSACGSNQSSSELNWEQSREDTKRYAYLWQSDLEDQFLFGGSVVAVDNFLSGALNFSLPPIKARLALNADETKLLVVDAEGQEEIMAFDVARDGDRIEVDFASAGNDLRLRGLIDAVGGQFTAERQDGFWISQGAPSVAAIDQDNDTVVVDLIHSVQQVLLGRNPFTGDFFVREVLTEEPGDVTFRLWLKRQKSNPQVGDGLKMVRDGMEKNVGFFGSSLAATGGEGNSPIQRFALGDAEEAAESITFYLKDFPEEFVDVGKEAVLSWNEAFDGEETIKVEIAPESMDVGDPRHHVIKWFDGTDRGLGWAGVAKMIVDPDTGVVMSGGVYIQGNTLINNYEDIMAFTTQAGSHTIDATATIGNVDLTLEAGENPVVPFFTDLEQDFAGYMQGYYKEVVAHEVGHVLGLRHNFRASIELDADGHAASVMDYAPRSERNKYEKPGRYDLAALRWAYYGEEPPADLPFCTDEDIRQNWDCNQGDYGDPIAFHIRGIVDSANLLAQAPVAITDDSWIQPIGGVVGNAAKIYRLRNQLSAAERAEVEEKIPAAVRYAIAVEPADGLSDADHDIVSDNLGKFKLQVRAALQ